MEDAELTAGKKLPGVPFTKDDPRINREGRPKGSYSLKTKIEKLLRENPEIEKKLIEDLLAKDQALIYQMIDGKPLQKSEIDMEANVQTGVVILPPKDELATSEETNTSTQ